MYTDPIADYLTRVRNAVAANHKVVEIPASNLKKEITKILFDQGYILSYKFEDNAVQGSIKIALKYDKDKESVIKISKELVNQVYVFKFFNHSKNP
jgi:small subunit ribosomal protein S8